MPSRLLASDIFVHAFVARIASTLFSSGEIPPALKTTPKNSILSRLNSHFCLLSVRPLSSSRLNSASSAASCFTGVDQYIRMSSTMFVTPSRSLTMVPMSFWKTSDAEHTPKCKRLYLKSPTCVLNVVIEREFLSNSSW